MYIYYQFILHCIISIYVYIYPLFNQTTGAASLASARSRQAAVTSNERVATTAATHQNDGCGIKAQMRNPQGDEPNVDLCLPVFEKVVIEIAIYITNSFVRSLYVYIYIYMYIYISHI